MRNFITARGRAAVIALFSLLLTIPISAQVGLRKAMDFDGDQKADFSIVRPSDNNWYILKSAGGAIVQNWGDANDDYPTPGDYDGDGKGDISVFRDSNGTWYRINSATNTVGIVNWGTTGDEPVARDFDGDGKTDFAVVRRSNGVMTWYVFRSSDLHYMVTQWGASTDYVTPGDYDGDGKFDVAIQRPGATDTSIATFYIYTQTGNVIVSQWGQSNDLVVPGDYDGDGKTDIAVVREGTTPSAQLTWFVLKSSNNQAIVQQWGATGTDLTTQNDYDGDGKTDIAIYRDSTGTFWVIRSLDSQFQSVQWGTSNDFPLAGYDTH